MLVHSRLWHSGQGMARLLDLVCCGVFLFRRLTGKGNDLILAHINGRPPCATMSVALDALSADAARAPTPQH